MNDNVCVAVRLRPFNDRERMRDAKCCVIVDPQQPNSCRLVPPQAESTPDSQKPGVPGRSFTFDHVFDSFTADHDRVATQRTVWEAVGIPVLEAAWGGYNVSVFAYGQTGSGKSHSMVGFDHTEKGIIPNTCEQLFQRIEANADPELTFRVECSMLEIYNERIRDLFVPFSYRPTMADKLKGSDAGLKVRDHPTLGVHVEGLLCAPVASYAQVERLMSEGTKNRTIAATNMNETSSRAHTICSLKLTSTRVSSSSSSSSESSNGGSGSGGLQNTIKAVDRTSLINLVDLAGSERQRASGVAGDRLKEAGAINKSLSALGNVISALAYNSGLASELPAKRAKRLAAHASRLAADQARGLVSAAAASAATAAAASSGGLTKHVPYRDSVLTHLLRNSLGGNARTTMLAAVSPADMNFDETLSTLRYADRAKQIKNTPVVNEGVDEKLVRDLKAQVEALRAELAAAKEGAPSHDASSLSSSTINGSIDRELMDASMRASAEVEEMRAVLDKERAAMRSRLEAEMAARRLEYEAVLLQSSNPKKDEDEAEAASAGASGEATTATSTPAALAQDATKAPSTTVSGPHLANLNEDPALSGVLVYPLREGRTRLGAVAAQHSDDHTALEEKASFGGSTSCSSSSSGGREGANSAALTTRGSAAASGCAHSVWLGGLGVLPVHAFVDYAAEVPDPEGTNCNYNSGSSSDNTGSNDDERLWLVPRPGARCCVNGKAVPASGVALRDNDRLVLGSTCVLRVRVPSFSSSSFDGKSGSGSSSSGSGVNYWEMAMAELNGELMAAMGRGGGGGNGSGGGGSGEGSDGGHGGGVHPEGLEALEQRFAEERQAMAARVSALELELASERNAMHAKQQRAENEAELEEGEVGKGVAAQQQQNKSGVVNSSLNSAAQSEADAHSRRQVAALEARLAEQVTQTRQLAARHELELKSRTVLDEQLLRALPLVHEANTISGELGKGMRFAVKLVSRTVDYGLGNVLPSADDSNGGSTTALSSSLGYGNTTKSHENNSSSRSSTGGGGGGKSRLATEIAVLVAHDLEPDREPALWPAAKFHNRIFLMREVYQLWLEAGRDVTAPPFATSVFASDAGDPFYDPPEDVLVGVARVQLEAVRWLLDVDEQTPLVDYRGARNGDLAVCLVPSLVLPGRRRRPRKDGDEGAPEDGYCDAEDQEQASDMGEDDYEDLADAPPGSGLALMVHLKRASSLPQRLVAPARSLYVSFRFPSAFLLENSSGSSNSSRNNLAASSSSERGSNSSSRRSEVVRSARVPLPGGHEHLCAPIEWAHTLELAVTPALVDFAATAALALEVWLSVDPPGPWTTDTSANAESGSGGQGSGSHDRGSHRMDGYGQSYGGSHDDYDSEDDFGEEGARHYYRDSLSDGSGHGNDSEESGSDSDEGLPPHGIAVMRNQPTAEQQRRRERQWQRQRQESEQGADDASHRHGSSSSPPHSPLRSTNTNFATRTVEQKQQQQQGPTAAEYAAVVAEAEQLRAENATLSVQLEDALKLIAAMQDAEAKRNREAATSESSGDGGINGDGDNDQPSPSPEDIAGATSAAAALALPNPAPLAVAVGKSARSRSRERVAAAAARLRLGDAQTLDREFNGAPSRHSAE